MGYSKDDMGDFLIGPNVTTLVCWSLTGSPFLREVS